MNKLNRDFTIERPRLPDNYYGMSIPINSLKKDNYIFIGSSLYAEPYHVQSVSHKDDSWEIVAFDYTSTKYTFIYPELSHVGISITYGYGPTI